MLRKVNYNKEEIRRTQEYVEAIALLKMRHETRCFLHLIDAQLKTLNAYSGIALKLAKEEVAAKIFTNPEP